MARKKATERSAKIERLIREGFPPKQAEAIAYREYGENGPLGLGRQPVFLLYLKAPNTPNGNPRRMFIVVNNDGTYEMADFGHEGLFQLSQRQRALDPFLVEITPRAYAQLKRDADSDPTLRRPR